MEDVPVLIPQKEYTKMKNEALFEALGKIFSGKGGSIRSAIFGIGLLGIIGAIIESNYTLEGSTSDGKSFSLKPSTDVPSEDTSAESGDISEQEDSEPLETAQPSE